MTNIVAPVVPQSSKPVDFIARRKAGNVTSVAATETKAQPQVASVEVATPVVAMTYTTAELTTTNVAEAPKAAIPADLTVPTVATNDVAPTPAVKSVAAASVQEEHDDLMALVQSNLQRNLQRLLLKRLLKINKFKLLSLPKALVQNVSQPISLNSKAASMHVLPV